MDRELEVVKSKTDVEVEKIDVLRHPLATIKDGIKGIPAVKIEDKILYGKDLKAPQIIKILMGI
ncbi:MAG: hypothetical protein GY714_04800 [Desulfobacterales bacterium]|nr:hypothetical protein [Desulfobacterales bacterium]MCP4162927.1 hypothetical protein [Deltaproteobacteria bacterium]